MLQFVQKGAKDYMHLYLSRLSGRTDTERDKIINSIARNGVSSGQGWKEDFSLYILF